MMKKIAINVVALFALTFVGGLALATPAHAADIEKGSLCSGANLDLGGDGDCSEGGPENTLNNLISNIVNIISIVVGIIAVIMIIIGGFRFITSGGDSGKIASARSTVIYAIVGLVIVALAQFIVRFVLSKARAE